MLMKKKREKIYDLVKTHMDSVGSCLQTFNYFLELTMEKGITERVKELGKQVGELESQADSNRHEIIMSLLQGALLPDTRREILKLIELVDEIANQCEELTKQIIIQKITFPSYIKHNINSINIKLNTQFNIHLTFYVFYLFYHIYIFSVRL